MILIFGVRRKRKQLGVTQATCPRCQRTCALTIICIRAWFTLFFLPIFPVSAKYYAVCSMCAGATQVDQSAAEHLAHAVPQPAPTQLPPGAAYPPQPTAGPPPSAPPPAPDYLSDGPPPEWNRGTQ